MHKIDLANVRLGTVWDNYKNWTGQQPQVDKSFQSTFQESPNQSHVLANATVA